MRKKARDRSEIEPERASQSAFMEQANRATAARDKSICDGAASRWTLRLQFVLCQGCGARAATLREVTNGIIENQYLRSVLALSLPPSPSPTPPGAWSRSDSRDVACSKSFGCISAFRDIPRES